ncbi:MAG: FtsQ-type POTRA domain-containing protein [Cyanobacteria bacterium CRU_2_1]|nr:FtsQ-type POTRA domain-containing protein [Cyanobacteria bacterium RU_5_0]NJR62999.1 FtsQ-type POTRA domain-containing protein [Cyanobacteria bacterium CRU_2_1]
MMADIPSVSQSELRDRRRRLRRQRRWRALRGSWQLLAVSGLTAGLVWALTLPDWMLRHPNQVTVEGNRLISGDTIRSLLPINYPQFLLTVQPQAIAHRLEAEAPIAEATVTRRLFPPSLTVRIQERYPVAIAFSSSMQIPSQSELNGSSEKGLLDEKGTWIPYERYVALNPSRSLPTLKVIGIREQYRSQWMSLYQQVSRSPVKISEIDWREPGNLILQTELGVVYFGAYGSRFAEQLRVLDQMRKLPEQVSLDEVAYIDLRNPEVPLIKMAGAVVSPQSPKEENLSENADLSEEGEWIEPETEADL